MAKNDIEITENISEHTRKYFNGEPYDGPLLSWSEFNRIAERIWTIEGKMEFIGVDMDVDGTMFCAFQIIYKKNKKGRIHCVNNDIIFDFQKKGSVPKKMSKYKQEDE